MRLHHHARATARVGTPGLNPNMDTADVGQHRDTIAPWEQEAICLDCGKLQNVKPRCWRCLSPRVLNYT